MAGGTQARFARWAKVAARASVGAAGNQGRATKAHFEKLKRTLQRELEAAAVESAKVIQMEIGHEIDRWADKPTGKLERSFKIKKLPTRTEAGHLVTSASVVSNSVYWRIHDQGGTIRPKTARYLTIPVTPQARAMPAKFWPRGSLFKPKGKMVLMSKGGPWEVNTRGVGARVQFILRDSVRIHAKNYVTRARDRARPRMKLIFDAALQRAQRGATNGTK